MRRRQSLHERMLAEEARAAPEPETAEQRLKRLASKPAVVVGFGVAAAIAAKFVAKAVGIHFLLHPGFIAGLVVVVAFAIALPLTLRYLRGRDA